MLTARRNAAWRERRQALQEAIPDSFWTALDRYDDGTWTAYTPGFAYEVAEREVSQRSAFAEAERHIARTIRAMYEVGHRLPAASPTLEAAQQEEGRNREAYEVLEERIREGDASSSGGGPKVVERQWLRVHVDLSLADSMDETPRLGRLLQAGEFTAAIERDDPDDDDSDSEEEGADMAEDEDAHPWADAIPRASDDDEGLPTEPESSARGAEIDSMRPFRTMANQAQLALQHMHEAEAAAAPPLVNVRIDRDGNVARAYDIGYNLNHGAPAVAGPAVRQPRHRVINPWLHDRTAVNSTLSGLTAQLRAQGPHTPSLPRRAPASWKQGDASLR